MSKKHKKIEVKGLSIAVFQSDNDDYISLTDIAKSKDNDSRAAGIIKNWIRNRGTIEFIGTWEQLHNPDFKVVEFDHFRMNAGLTSFVLSPGKWIEQTNAIGIVVKKGNMAELMLIKISPLNFALLLAQYLSSILLKSFND